MSTKKRRGEEKCARGGGGALVAEHAAGEHYAELAAQLAQVLLGPVRGHVLEVEVRAVGLLALRHLRLQAAPEQVVERVRRRLVRLEVHEAVALAGARVAVQNRLR